MQNGTFKAVGAPTEAALLVLVEKMGVPQAAAQEEIKRLRSEDPDSFPCGACDHYAAKYAADCDLCCAKSEPCRF